MTYRPNEKEAEACRATMEHWADDVIPYMKKAEIEGRKVTVTELLDADLIGDYSCPLCLFTGGWCAACPYFLFYGKWCSCDWTTYKQLTKKPTLARAIDCYNIVADIIGADHYPEEGE